MPLIQQEKVIAELTTHLQTTKQSSDTKYDSATLEYLMALRNIFELGLLSHENIVDGDATLLQNMLEGLSYFEEWCDEVRTNGRSVNYNNLSYITPHMNCHNDI